MHTLSDALDATHFPDGATAPTEDRRDSGQSLLDDPTEDALRALGQDILDEPVPEHLLALLRDAS